MGVMKHTSTVYIGLLAVLLIFVIATLVLSVIVLTKANKQTSATICDTTQSPPDNVVDWRSRSTYHQHRIQVVVLHDTVTASAEETVNVLNKQNLSVHYIVEKNGVVYYLVDESERAYHAGKSGWGSHIGLNDASIGIEIVNSGFEDFTDAQMTSVTALCKTLMGRWNITPQNFVAHGDIAPGRKQDVSGYFNWTTFYAELEIFPGLFVSNITANQQKGVLLSSSTNSNVVNANVTNLQQRLSNYGYVSEIDVNGIFDAKTEAVVEAFNRHFCPEIFVKEKEHTYDDNSSNSPNQQWYGISEERLTYLLKNTNRDLCPQC